MAIITPSELFSNIKGSIGSTTFATIRAGLIAKKKLVGKRNYTNKQGNVLKNHVFILSQWQNLTLLEQIAWNDYASLWPQINRFGETKYLTGLNWFSHMNNLKFEFDGTFLTTPPSREGATIVGLFDLVLSSTQCKVVFDEVFNAPNNLLYIFITLPNQLTLSRNRGKFRLIKTVDIPNTSEIDLTADYENYFKVNWANMVNNGNFKMQCCMYTVNKTSWENSIQLCSSSSIEPIIIFNRITENGDDRITENNDIRILE